MDEPWSVLRQEKCASKAESPLHKGVNQDSVRTTISSGRIKQVPRHRPRAKIS